MTEGVILGRDTTLSISLDDGVTFRLLAPVTVRDLSIGSPVVDTTAQDTQGDYSEMNHTGYTSMVLSVAGIVKQTTGNDPIFGQPLYTMKDILGLVNASPVTARKGLFRLADSLNLWEGDFLITEFGRTGGRSDISEFNMSLLSSGANGGIAYLDGEFYDFMIFMEKTLPDLWVSFL